MALKVFALGRPGGGKTTAVFQLHELARRKGYTRLRTKDYDILYEMYKKDMSQHATPKKFGQADYGGFDVFDKSVFDIALEKLEKQTTERMKGMPKNTLVTIEFARDEYHKALGLFSKEFLRDAYVLFVDADLITCMKRIHQRVGDSPRPDFHFVSNYIMQTYYHKDNWDSIEQQLKDYPLKGVFPIRNSGLKEEFVEQVNLFADIIFPFDVEPKTGPLALEQDEQPIQQETASTQDQYTSTPQLATIS